eukprot:Gregarina_sp_Poly_1__11155@NODE_907_length_5760_cov_97_276656_g646_i0_p6_GENE_NODE_907_length_5760_cov_97_276656_g646_i0NODE_907_length_5760_cov_97_276656_g646_i0_p6_ORF_typecomplete_len108_score12_27Herpes_gE/PF02480_16/4_2e05Shisa/PF13908_6/0_00072TMEM100/PF16311_5/0_0091CD34_antigen/PF06365_12/0_022Cadherin_C_2/PF16492_5/0_028DUF4719/PF15843_5/0_043TMEM154/PF15102_6/0_073PRIMA1/PF16101_5/0_079Comm/PF15957_5/0_2_NODE_907_length_5760_cov_97_276656_g646_i016021925
MLPFNLVVLARLYLVLASKPKKRTVDLAEPFPRTENSRFGLIASLSIVTVLFVIGCCAVSYVCVKSRRHRRRKQFNSDMFTEQEDETAAVVRDSPENQSPRAKAREV